MKIFLSYAREDEKIAQKIYSDLQNNGLKVWLDKNEILPGENWKLKITKAIKESTHFLALISDNSVNKRGFVQKELKLAFEVLQEMPESEIYMIPIRINNCVPKDNKLNDIQWVDLFPSYNEALEKLLNSLKVKSNVKTNKTISYNSFKKRRLFYMMIFITSIILTSFLYFDYAGMNSKINIIKEQIIPSNSAKSQKKQALYILLSNEIPRLRKFILNDSSTLHKELAEISNDMSVYCPGNDFEEAYSLPCLLGHSEILKNQLASISGVTPWDSRYGYREYNPEFLYWILANIDPDFDNKFLEKMLKISYDSHFKYHVRRFYLTYQVMYNSGFTYRIDEVDKDEDGLYHGYGLINDPGGRARDLEKHYVGAIIPTKKDSLEFISYDYEDYVRQVRKYKKENKQYSLNDYCKNETGFNSFCEYSTHREFNSSDGTVAMSFWVRRKLDGTKELFFEAIVKILRSHDPTFYSKIMSVSSVKNAGDT